MNNIVGIDLGTTFSGISRLNSIGNPEICPFQDGQRILASAIYFDEDKTLVGEIAKNQSEIDDSRYASIIKRYMGDEFFPKEVIGKKWTPSRLSSIILAKIKNDFEAINGKIDKCVITVPAYFDEIRRKATMEAASLANIDIVGIVNEPTAAALYYSSLYDINGKSLVFDLGGGTFDVTILDMKDRDVNILSSKGDHKLGGYDFDIAILDDIQEKYKEQHNIDLVENIEQKNHLIHIAEVIKKTLSTKTIAQQRVYGSKGDILYSLNREGFEKLISSYFAKIEMLIESALDEINLNENEIDQIILVGGSSRIPMVEQTIMNIFNKKPLRIGNVDECVSLGAAIYAGLQTLKSPDKKRMSTTVIKSLESISLNDVCNHSYGTLSLSYDEDLEKLVLLNDILIKKNTKLPYSITKTYYTVHENQEIIDVSVTQGESIDPDDVNILSNKEMLLPSGRPPQQPVKVTYSYDENQRMECVFYDVNSGHEEKISLDNLDRKKQIDDDEFSAYLDF